MGKRALSVDNILNQRHNVLDFDGPWRDSVGTPEMASRWLIWGSSGSGKTRCALQLSKYLCRFGRVAYNSLEEGNSFSIQLAIKQLSMQDVRKRFMLLDREPIQEMIARMKAHKGPRIGIVDSVQYTGLTYRDYVAMSEALPHSMLIFISHADGKEPAGRVAKAIRYDAGIKIFAQGFKAMPMSRYGGGEEYIISEEKAREYWAFDY